MFGRGSYFARDSSYSIDYCTGADSQGAKYILQCRVVVGEYVRGDSSMKTPPYKRGTTEKFDSTVNDDNNPSIFVVYTDAAAYPEYIIKFQ